MSPLKELQSLQSIEVSFYNLGMLQMGHNANDAGGGKIIDSSLIFWATEFGGGNENTDSHPGFNKTVALLGGADGFLKKNQYVEVSGDTNARSVANNQILTTICRYMGVAGSFGEGAGSNTTLQSIIA